MKISDSNRTRDKLVRLGKNKKSTSVKHSPFLEVLQEKDSVEHVYDYALEDIDQIGKQLKENPNFENLRAYKEAVKSFLTQIITKSYQLEERRFIDTQGRRRVYLLVNQIDAELEELTRMFFNRHLSTLNLAKKLDEIRGLLLDVNL